MDYKHRLLDIIAKTGLDPKIPEDLDAITDFSIGYYPENNTHFPQNIQRTENGALNFDDVNSLDVNFEQVHPNPGTSGAFSKLLKNGDSIIFFSFPESIWFQQDSWRRLMSSMVMMEVCKQISEPCAQYDFSQINGRPATATLNFLNSGEKLYVISKAFGQFFDTEMEKHEEIHGQISSDKAQFIKRRLEERTILYYLIKETDPHFSIIRDGDSVRTSPMFDFQYSFDDFSDVAHYPEYKKMPFLQPKFHSKKEIRSLIAKYTDLIDIPKAQELVLSRGLSIDEKLLDSIFSMQRTVYSEKKDSLAKTMYEGTEYGDL